MLPGMSASKITGALALGTLLALSAGSGCRTPPRGAPPAIEFRLAHNKPAPGCKARRLPGGAQMVYVEPTPVLTGRDILSASTVESLGDYGLMLVFTPTASARLAEVTGRFVGERLALFVDGKLRSAPLIREQITSGRAAVFGDFTRSEAEALARRLQRR